MVKIVKIKKDYEKNIKRGVLTVYSKWISDDGGAEKGEEIILVNHKRQTIGMGVYEGIGAIGVRLLKIGCEEPIADIIKRNILKAYEKRRFYPYNSKRIVNADADYLPGLIVDKYNEIAVIQSSSIGMDRHIHYIGKILKRYGIAESIYVRNDQRSRIEAGLERWREWLIPGDTTTTIIDEGKARFIVDIEEGHKTGFYLDQRLNRLEMAKYSKEKRVLDLYSYTGGFGIQCLLNKGNKAVFVEENKKALEILYENIKLNKVENRALIYEGKVENYLKEEDDKFDMIIFDPPAFVQTKDNLEKGVNKYRHIINDSLKKIHEGLLFISSCSYFITPNMLKNRVIKPTLEYNNRNYCFWGYVRGLPPDHLYRSIDRSLRYLKSYILQIY